MIVSIDDCIYRKIEEHCTFSNRCLKRIRIDSENRNKQNFALGIPSRSFVKYTHVCENSRKTHIEKSPLARPLLSRMSNILVISRQRCGTGKKHYDENRRRKCVVV